MKKTYLIILVFIILVVAWFFLRFIIGGSEDSWIKNEKGVWVKHGEPAETPDYVKEQQNAISCALNLYNQKKLEGMVFSSQCLGGCEDYAIDIVHVPRSEEDDKIENQCQDYREGKVNHFLELDKDGEIVRIV